MDVNKSTSIPPTGDAPGRKAERQHHGSDEGEDTTDKNSRSWSDDSAVALAGLAGEELSLETRRILEAMAAQIEPMRLEVEQAKAREARYYELAIRHPILAVPNRREFERELQYVIDHLEGLSPSVALMIVNLANAEELRGQLGRQAVDAAMAHVVALIDEIIAPTDEQGSLCGHDLGVILLNGDAETIALRTENIHRRVRNNPLNWRGKTHLLKVRTGAAIMRTGSRAVDALQAADNNLINSAISPLRR